MARINEIRMCIGCGHFDTDPEAQQFCHAGCDGCSHSFEPFLDVDGVLLPVAPDYCCPTGERYEQETGAYGDDHLGECDLDGKFTEGG